jgi:hypothetical protein
MRGARSGEEAPGSRVGGRGRHGGESRGCWPIGAEEKHANIINYKEGMKPDLDDYRYSKALEYEYRVKTTALDTLK